MWKKSRPGDYNSFRTFIFGITKQSMFPHGVIYEGVSEEPLSFRGESGANDSMVSSDIIFQKSPQASLDTLTSSCWKVGSIVMCSHREIS